MTPTPAQGAMDEALFCFSHLRWTFVYQRPQHLMSRAARRRPVFFVEEPVWVGAGQARFAIERHAEVVRVVPELPLELRGDEGAAAMRSLVHTLLASSPARRRTAWCYTPAALAIMDPEDFDLVVYDCMDELSAFAGAGEGLIDAERRLFAGCDVVFTGGQSLFEAKRRRHPNVHLEPSSVDVAHFAQARRPDAPEPEDQAPIAGPRLGWFGVIDERMDMALLAEMARLRPAWNFVMIGPVVKIDPAELPQAENIRWLGAKAYNELPGYLAGWDVGLMNFARNAATRFISPTKTPEYLAAGLPVVSTPIADVVRPYGEEGLVAIAETAQEAVVAAERLMRAPKDVRRARADLKLGELSWDKTWSRMEAAMAGARAARELAAAS
jgi:glycosyltransferase involved in cell wall biosynthesis